MKHICNDEKNNLYDNELIKGNKSQSESVDEEEFVH